MKKFVFIVLFLIVIIGGGWMVNTYHHSQPKTDDVGINNLIIDGNTFLNKGRYDEAKRLFLAALSAEPKNVNAAWGLKKTEAKDFLSLNSFKLAVDSLYQQNPSDAHVNLFLGEFYVANHQPDQAIPYFEQAITQNPKLAEAYFDLAMIYEQQGNINRAKSELSLAIDIAPTAKYRNKLAHIYIKQNHFDAATAEYEKSSEYPLSALNVAQIYWQRDRLDLALIRQLQAVKLLNDKSVMAQPENQDPWFFKLSEEQTLALTKLDEKKSYAYLCLSFTLSLLENTDEAERYIQEMRNLLVTRQADINTIVNADLDALLQEKTSLASQVEAFKRLYLVTTTTTP
ncbi:MAG: tetratricopeptide repeat protein [Methylococcaceae bacterium]|nr:tetratricopeptide repeat protein [Methylococcaceae bacterium]MDD1609017.1 tetratricopeptide repeat protein [Methylococcaceae bacterium]